MEFLEVVAQLLLGRDDGNARTQDAEVEAQVVADGTKVGLESFGSQTFAQFGGDVEGMELEDALTVVDDPVERCLVDAERVMDEVGEGVRRLVVVELAGEGYEGVDVVVVVGFKGSIKRIGFGTEGGLGLLSELEFGLGISAYGYEVDASLDGIGGALDDVERNHAEPHLAGGFAQHLCAAEDDWGAELEHLGVLQHLDQHLAADAVDVAVGEAYFEEVHSWGLRGV